MQLEGYHETSRVKAVLSRCFATKLKMPATNDPSVMYSIVKEVRDQTQQVLSFLATGRRQDETPCKRGCYLLLYFFNAFSFALKMM